MYIDHVPSIVEANEPEGFVREVGRHGTLGTGCQPGLSMTSLGMTIRLAIRVRLGVTLWPGWANSLTFDGWRRQRGGWYERAGRLADGDARLLDDGHDPFDDGA